MELTYITFTVVCETPIKIYFPTLFFIDALDFYKWGARCDLRRERFVSQWVGVGVEIRCRVGNEHTGKLDSQEIRGKKRYPGNWARNLGLYRTRNGDSISGTQADGQWMAAVTITGKWRQWDQPHLWQKVKCKPNEFILWSSSCAWRSIQIWGAIMIFGPIHHATPISGIESSQIHQALGTSLLQLLI